MNPETWIECEEAYYTDEEWRDYENATEALEGDEE